MKDQCIATVSKVVGRQITKAEADGIEARIRRNMKYAATTDPEYRNLSESQRLLRGAALAAEEIKAEASLDRTRMLLNAKAQDLTDNQIKSAKALGMDALDVIERKTVNIADFKTNILSQQSLSQAIEREALRTGIAGFEAVDPRFWGLFENKEGIRLLMRALYGEETGNAKIDAGAKALRDMLESLRKRFNAAGGAIGHLIDWGIPQHHDQMLVAKAGMGAWVKYVFERLNRNKYMNPDGSRMSDAEVTTFLQKAFETIATNGANKIVPGEKTGFTLANAMSEHRQIHFRDAQAAIEYHEAFSAKSFYGVVTGHVRSLSRLISLVETWGSNPDGAFEYTVQREAQAMKLADPTKSQEIDTRVKRLQKQFEFSTGKAEAVNDPNLARNFDTLRAWLVASRLGSAVITALADQGTIVMASIANKLPQVELFRNQLAVLNPANRVERRLAERAGLGLDAITSELNRWADGNLGSTWSNKMASTVMKLSLLEALDNGRRRFFGVTMMGSIGSVTRERASLRNLEKGDLMILQGGKATETDFQVWKLADLEQWGASKHGILTPESIAQIPEERLAPLVEAERARLQTEMENKVKAIMRSPLEEAVKQASAREWGATYAQQMRQVPERIRRDAMTKLLALTLEETDMAVMRPGIETKMWTRQGERGTWGGELWNSVFIFQSFPIAILQKHIVERGLGQDTVGGKATYIASLMAMTTVLGAMSQSVSELLQGKDIRNYDPLSEHGVKNWISAFLKGGSMGVYGDFLFSSTTHHSQNSLVAKAAGPIAGLVEDAYNMTIGNIGKAAEGKNTNFGADAVRFVKQNTPGASLWYLRAALDHMIVHNLQEMAKPGYLATMQRRTQKEFGQSYWWQPGTGIEGMRMPEIAR